MPPDWEAIADVHPTVGLEARVVAALDNPDRTAAGELEGKAVERHIAAVADRFVEHSWGGSSGWGEQRAVRLAGVVDHALGATAAGVADSQAAAEEGQRRVPGSEGRTQAAVHMLAAVRMRRWDAIDDSRLDHVLHGLSRCARHGVDRRKGNRLGRCSVPGQEPAEVVRNGTTCLVEEVARCRPRNWGY